MSQQKNRYDNSENKIENLFSDARALSLPEHCLQSANLLALKNAELLAISTQCLSLFDIDLDLIKSSEYVALISGNKNTPTLKTFAYRYSGHQFGHYVSQLGDGRAVTLGEIKDVQGSLWEFQIKGSGPTPFSRGGDGRAVLRSSIRELLCSEAMAALNIPTTRALCLVGSLTPVYRETQETAASIVRLAQSHLRFGSFEILAHQNNIDSLKKLTDFCIENFIPDISVASSLKYEAFFAEVAKRTALLIAQWQSVGFCHGVMNSDNMSILGLTIDYGPFAFMEEFKQNYICNHSDHGGRYSYAAQPSVGFWNLRCLAAAFLPLVNQSELQDALSGYFSVFNAEMLRLARLKLGLNTNLENDFQLWTDLLEVLEFCELDFTRFFRSLARWIQGKFKSWTFDCGPEMNQLNSWLDLYQKRLELEAQFCFEKTAMQMNVVNPKYILRNSMAEVAIQRANVGDMSEVNLLLELLSKPFDENLDFEKYAQKSPHWSKSMIISCSS